MVLQEKKGENAINPAFRSKVDEIISKPNDELEKMKFTIEESYLGRGNASDSFWNCVKQKILEKLS